MKNLGWKSVDKSSVWYADDKAVVAIQAQFKRCLNQSRWFDTDKLRYDLTMASTYAIALNNRFHALTDLPDDVEPAWPIETLSNLLLKRRSDT